MPSPPDLPTALAEHAATHPRDPWLFYPEGLDWRWISYEQAVRPGFLPPARGGTEGGLPPACGGIEGVLADASAQAGLMAAADRIAACLPPTTAGWAGRRDIVVLSPPWEEPAARSMLAWAVVTGAAVVLEPDPARRVGTAAWARPTVFHGSAAEVGALCRAAAKAAGRRWWRTRRPQTPFGRLRAALLTGDDQPFSADRLWLTDHGVTIVCGGLRFPGVISR